MAVTAREAWTDERLDDLNAKVERGFERVDEDIRELRGEMKSGFDSLHARLDSMQRTMVICFATLSASIVASVFGAGLVA